jgi:P27 family predicted phage terminase small subunit
MKGKNFGVRTNAGKRGRERWPSQPRFGLRNLSGAEMPQPRKADAVHNLQGTRPHDRAADISSVPAGRPKIPRDIGPGLRKVFKNLCNLLQERRTLTRADAELIRLYCFQYERHEKNVALLREEGELCTYVRLDSHGQQVPQVKTNLRLKVVTDAERQMAAILNQLGLTPTAKDRAKPTGGVADHEVIPGSLEALRPELFRRK